MLPNLADIRDAARAAWWRFRTGTVACGHRLTGRTYLACTDPQSPEALGNWIFSQLCRAAPDELPVRLVLTPGNVLEFTAPLPGTRPFTPAQNDSQEAWRRLQKTVRRTGADPIRIISAGRHHVIRLQAVLENPHRIVVTLDADEPIPRPEEVTARLGMEPGEPVLLTGRELGDLIASRLAHECRPPQTVQEYLQDGPST
jgi:hypothetical protein